MPGLTKLLKRGVGARAASSERPPIKPGELSKQDEAVICAQWLAKSFDSTLDAIPSFGARGGSFHASAIGNPCDRFLYYHYHGLLVEEKIPAKLRRIFDHGIWTQKRYREYFEKMRVFVAEEIPCSHESPNIRGRADFLLTLPVLPEKVILELKTINDDGFTSCVNFSKPKEDHFIQLQTYLNTLKLPVGIVWYENKNNQETKAFPVRRDVDVWHTVLERCLYIQGLDKAPDPPANHDKWCKCLQVK